MQHGPSMSALVFLSLILFGMAWLGSRILPKWHDFYAKNKVRYCYWGLTGLAALILAYSRWLKPAGLPGEWFRYLNYFAYIWFMGLFFALLLLIVTYAGRLDYKKLRKKLPPREEADKPEAAAAEGITRRQFLSGMAAVLPTVPLLTSAYGVIGAETIIRVNRYRLSYSNLPPAFEGLKIAQISDTHIGNFFGINRLDRVLKMVKAENPDLLVITGDLIDDLGLLAPTVERLAAFQPQVPQGIFYCFDNHEYFRDIAKIRTALKNSPLRVLDNTNYALQAGGQRLYLAGVDYPWGNNKFEVEYKRKHYLDLALKGIAPGEFTVLLTHHPDFFDNAFAAGVPLTLAGHTHGGQVEIFGKSILPVKYKYMRGMFEHNNLYGYVNVGTGHWLPLRVGCPAEISMFTLTLG